MKSVLLRLASCILITPEFSEHFLKVFEAGESSFTGSLMDSKNACPPLHPQRSCCTGEKKNQCSHQFSTKVHTQWSSILPPSCRGSLWIMHRGTSCIHVLVSPFLKQELSVNKLVECHCRGRKMSEKLKEMFQWQALCGGGLKPHHASRVSVLAKSSWNA